MRIPKTLKVGAHTFTVKTTKMDKCGELDREKMTLYLADWLPQTQKESTLIHEILHAINNELDHALLDSLAEQLYAVLKENRLV